MAYGQGYGVYEGAQEQRQADEKREAILWEI